MVQELAPEDRVIISDRVLKLNDHLNETPKAENTQPQAPKSDYYSVIKTRNDANISQLSQRRRDTILDMVKKLQVLPVSSSAPMQILNLQKDKKAGAADYARILSIDSGLSSKVLGLANSSWFSPRNPITRLPAAIAAIGLRNLLPLVFSLSLTGSFSELKIPAFEKDAIWRGSLLKAACAREYARVFCPGLEEEAFLCGLMQDIGLPLLYASDTAAWPEITSQLDTKTENRYGRELMLYGLDHIELTRLVGQRLGIPETLLGVMDAHHEPLLSSCNDENQHLANSVRLAGLMPHRVMDRQNAAYNLREPVGHYTPSGNDISIAKVLGCVPAAYKELLCMLGASDNSGGLNEFLQKMSGEMSRTMEEAINISQRQVAQLQNSHDELKVRLAAMESQAAVAGDFDVMTRLLNRSGLSRRTANIFSVAKEYKQECGLVHITLSNFKELNRKCGHEQGDKILMSIADSLRKFLKGAGIGSRISGVEFVLIFLGKNRQESINLIETLKTDLTSQRAGDNQIPLETAIRTLWLNMAENDAEPEKALSDFIAEKIS